MPQSAELISLLDLPHDTPARLAVIQGGRHLTRRLMALGLRPGSLLSVVQRRSQGLVLASGEVRIAIGAGMADKLLVTLAEPRPDGPPVVSTEEGPEVAMEMPRIDASLVS